MRGLLVAIFMAVAIGAQAQDWYISRHDALKHEVIMSEQVSLFTTSPSTPLVIEGASHEGRITPATIVFYPCTQAALFFGKLKELEREYEIYMERIKEND